MNMIELRVIAIALDQRSGEPIILLNDPQNERTLPIWVGVPEARAIGMAMSKVSTARPLTHDLLLNVIKRFGCSVREVLIDELDSGTFKSLIVLDSDEPGGTPMRIDARPSDAIAIAALAGCPVLASPSILEHAGIKLELGPNLTGEQDALDEDKFRRFLGEVKASDFKLPSSTETLAILPEPGPEVAATPDETEAAESNEIVTESVDEYASDSTGDNESPGPDSSESSP